MKLTIILIGVLMVLALSSPASATWWNASWDHRIPVEMNNTAGAALVDYQINVTLSPGINASSLRVVNNETSVVVPHWNETVVSGDVTELWFLGNVSAGIIDSRYRIYYGNANASITSDYDATFTKESTSPLREHACVFDEFDDFINCGNDSSLDITDDIAISCWIKPGALGISHGILQKGDISNNLGKYEVHITNANKLRFVLNGETSLGSLTSDTLMTDEWTHIIATRESGVMKLYINSVQDANTKNYATAITTDDNYLYVGLYWSTSYTFNGSISDHMVYNRALNAADAKSIYLGTYTNRTGLVLDLPFNESSIKDTDTVVDYSGESNDGTCDFTDADDHAWSGLFDLDRGLVMELHMDEGSGNATTYDSSGYGNNGTLTNMNVTGNATSGWQGTDGGQWDGRSDMVFASGDHLRFDGSNDYVDCGQDSTLNPISAISVSMWINPSAHTHGQSLMMRDTYNEWVSMYLRTGADAEFAFSVGGSLLMAGNYSVDTWYHVVGTFDKDLASNQMKLYVNGNNIGVGTRTSVIPISTTDLKFGKPDAGKVYFKGDIDEARIYNRALGGDEIYRQYIRSKYAADAPVPTLGDAQSQPVPPTPISLTNTTGFFWVNHTWAHGIGNVTDSYNVSVNGVWHNTTNTFYNDTYSAHAWQNITVWAYNASGDEVSTDNVSQNTQAPPAITITLLSQTPEELYQNSTGYHNQTWGISHGYPLNESAITYIYHNRFDGDAHHSLRMPINNRTETGWRGDHRNETGSNRLLMEDNTTIFGDGYYNWSAGDIEHNVRMHVVNMNATYTIINFNNSASGTIFSSSWYLDKSDMINATKTTLQISKHNARLVKIYDPEMIQGRDRNYTVSIWIDTVDNAQPIIMPMSIWWANASFDPDGGVCITDSPYAVQMGTITDSEWEDTHTIPHTGNYMKFSVYAGQDPEIQPTNTSYLYFEHDFPRPYYFNATDATTSTNVSFADSHVMWTSKAGSTNYTLDSYTPNIFLTFHRGNQTFESQLWAKDTGGNLTGSELEQTTIQTSNFPPTAGSFDHFGFAGYNDTNMDCVYRDNITLAYITSADPDGGNVTCNLTLCYANGTHVATINDSAVSDSPTQFEFEFNTTPYYSTTELYTLKAVCTDDESDTVTYWLPADFACSPLGTSGAIYNGLPTTPRVLFWGINDIPSLYSTVGNDSLISLSGGIYSMHCTFHHGQYGDDFAVNETIRIISDPTDETPFFRFTGSDEFDAAHIVAWNATLSSTAAREELFRSHVTSDEYYSRVNMTNCNLSHLGHGADQYRGVYIGNAEGATINNNTFIDNYNGVYIVGGGNFTITNNTIIDPIWRALFLENTNGNASVRDNVLHSDIQTSGIRMINGGCDNEFINNTITGLVESGFYTRNVTDSMFQYNTIHGVQFGLTLSSGNQNLTIVDNDIEVYEDAEGHPAWGIMILSGTHNISNNIIDVDNGYGMDVANWYTDVPCVNSLFANNSITITPGYHSEGGQFVHYLFEAKGGHNTTGNIIRNPPAETSSFRIADTGSDVLIENTDNTAFTEDSDCITIARPENFSMFVNTTTLFNVTRVGMVVTPATSALNIWNLVYGNDVTFNASTDTPADQVWFNFTNSAWADRNITVYRNNTEYYNGTANDTGVFDYHYTGGWSEKYFAFIRGATIPVSEVVTPANGATGISTNPTLSVVVTDGDGGQCDVIFYQYGGSQIGATQTGITNGSIASVIWSGRSYSTTYQWYAVADNGMETGQSSTWHFTTQGSGSGSSHTIFITGCTDWSGNAGSQVYIDFGASGETAGETFTTTATQGTINPSTGVYVWNTNVTDDGTYIWRFDVENVYSNSDYCDVTITVHHHASPADIAATTGNFWVDHTWSGNGFVDSYNVSVNGVWTNGSASQSYYHVRTPHAWSNISVAAYNLTTGLSSFISNDVQVPNNPIQITNYNELMLVTVGDTATVDMNHEDMDGDTATYSCSRTDLFTDFSTVNGTGHYTNAINGTYDVIFGVTDGYVWSNVTVIIEVGAVHPLELDEEMPLILFVVLIVILFAALFYIYHAESYVARIVTSLITVWMSFMLSNMSVSGNVVINYAELSSGDTFVYGTHSIQIAALSHFFMFIGVVSALFMFVFVVKLVIEIYSGIDAEKKEEEEWDGVDR